MCFSHRRPEPAVLLTFALRGGADNFRNYFRQLREETCERLLEVTFTKDGNPNKWWMSFSKRKFMNITDCA